MFIAEISYIHSSLLFHSFSKIAIEARGAEQTHHAEEEIRLRAKFTFPRDGMDSFPDESGRITRDW